jgi:hypothetical protein
MFSIGDMVRLRSYHNCFGIVTDKKNSSRRSLLRREEQEEVLNVTWLLGVSHSYSEWVRDFDIVGATHV